MSAKELGQIHVVNYRQSTSELETPGTLLNIDLPGQLTSQLQRMVRAGTYHKVVGIDVGLDTVGTIGGGQITGHFRYFAPTQGRCEAFRGAFKAMKGTMKNQGITTITNKMYDFRAPLNDIAAANGEFPNRATLDGTNGLALYHTTEAKSSIFNVHNRSVQPGQELPDVGDLFGTGFDTLLQSGGSATDFVLNDTVPFTGNSHIANTEYEKIPFMLSWTPDSTDISTVWQWRPDPALFLAVLCGQLQMVIEEINLDGTPTPDGLNVEVAVMVSGWKSIMGNPSRKSKRKSSSKKRGSKK